MPFSLLSVSTAQYHILQNTFIMNSGGLFKIYSERKTREAADYVVAIDAEFGAGHLQHSILPGTVSISFTKRKLLDILISFTKNNILIV